MAALLSGPSPANASHAPIEGFGAATTGGAGKPQCVVTSLADSGPGTLRGCLASGHRTVTFAVAGTIRPTSQLSFGGPFVTIDGFTAPSPGITLDGFGLNIWNQHDIIVRGLRIRNVGGGFAGKASIDCIGMLGTGTYNVVIDHVSIYNCADGGIDISSGPRNITIQWSIVSTPKAMLWGSTSSSADNTTDRISMHHTALICGEWPPIDGMSVGCDRFPLIRASGYVLAADVRRNVFSGWLRANGTKIEPAAWVNVVGNAYIPAPESTYSQRNASIAVNSGTSVYTDDNIELGALPRPDLNDNGNESRPMAAPPITERPLGCVVRDAGMHPRDAVDRKLLTYVTQVPDDCSDAPLPVPPPTSPPILLPDLVSRVLTAPSTELSGTTFSVTATIANVGTGVASPSTAHVYLSTDSTVGAGDVSLGTLTVPSLGANGTYTGTMSLTVPVATTAAVYRLILRADATGAISESNESNNTLSMPLTVTSASGEFAPLVLEAESMTVMSGMTVGSDAGALGGRYLSPTSGRNSTAPVREASVTVAIPVAGTYYLWARMYGPSPTSDALYVGIDSSWDRVYPTASGKYQWVRIETANGSGAFGFRLAAGTRTIQVGRGELNTRLDALYLTNRATDVPVFAPSSTPSMPVLLQAESMAVSSGMTVGSDPGAIGGRYLSPTSGGNSTTPAREASVTVTIPASGTYYLWVRMYGPSPTSDALYVGIDSSWDRVYPGVSGTYQWVRIETANGSGNYGFQLAPGTRTIQVGRGELNTRLDAVYLTNKADDVPGFGPQTALTQTLR